MKLEGINVSVNQAVEEFENSFDQEKLDLADKLKDVIKEAVQVQNYGSWADVLDEDGIVILSIEPQENGDTMFDFGGSDVYIQHLPEAGELLVPVGV